MEFKRLKRRDVEKHQDQREKNHVGMVKSVIQQLVRKKQVLKLRKKLPRKKLPRKKLRKKLPRKKLRKKLRKNK